MAHRRRLPALAFVLVIAVGSSAAFAQAPSPPSPPAPPRDNAPPPPVVGTATVRGQITSAATGQPLYRVRITMNGAVANPPTAVTDANGLFELTHVPAGTYSLTAARTGYLTVQYGQRRPRESGRTLPVKNGDVIEHIDMALFGGAVLAGRIVDDLGDPAAGVRVDAMDVRDTRGRHLPLPAGITTTNDLGEFRISGLEPGDYYLKASTTETWAAEGDKKAAYAYAETFYPGVVGPGSGQMISLATGQEVDSLDFPLSVGRAARISGVLLNANGEPMASQAVNLDRIGRTIGGALQSAGFGGAARTDRNGAFEIHDLPPGEYRLYSGNPQADSASINSLIVSDSDVDGLVLTPRRASSVRGTITTDDGTAPPFPPARIRVTPVPADDTNVLPPWGTPTAQTPGSDWSFRFTNIDGPYLFRPTGLPDDWMLQSVRLNGRDVTDAPLDIPKGGSETSGVQIVITRRTATLAGKVVTPAGDPLADSTVIVFAADDRRWGIGTRFVKSTRPDIAGHFSVGGLPPGNYLAIAKDFVADGQWEDPDYLRSLASDASTLTLSEDAEQAVTLVLKPEAQR